MNETLPTATHGQMELLVAAIRDYAIYMLSPEGIVITWNTGAQRFKGYTAEEIIGQHFSTFHTPEDQAAGIPAIALRQAREEGKFECEGWRVRKDGSRFWASVVMDPVVQDGVLVGFAKITRDITEKRRAEDELLASERQFRMLVQGVLDYAIYMISPQGIVTNWNSGARRIKGYDASEIVGRHFSHFYTEEERARGTPLLALQEAADKGRYEAEGWRLRKDGTTFWAHVVIDAIRDDSGALLGFAKITRDITERREAEQSLDQARAQLFQSQKMEAVGQLTGGVAHDFNNLLSIISSAVQILQKQNASALEKSIIDTIGRAVERGSTLTQQLLAFARQQPLAPANHRINRVIESFEPVLRRAVPSSIRFETVLARDVGWVNLDEARFEAALLNLVVNARDAMPDGGSITLSTARVPAGGDQVRITVTDTGTGMDAELAARVFEPFFTTKDIGKGTGLGLSQVQGFIMQSGGQVTLESTPGHGTSVHLTLPMITVTEEEAAPAGELVIIVEDEPELAALAGTLFESIGYQVLIADGGEQALRLLAQNPGADLLFSDVMMPGMSGIELARKVRAQYPGLKIILASGYQAPALRAEGSIDDVAFVSKPYRLSEIVKRLR
ncbi:PAS domain-containing sensor histidine kinase [Massilia sp. CF038]|uniref:hybrid sensor histidine kinase/response regulator n=1 Tax=Massilia sp. CF038 TaxID=1881045 RepID=UPI000920F2C0|nr:PAS domain-containing sensor histidine kinase [Massilia sp. CF038]SHG57799.1 PAS domain S-box-containing protein [Massilia sp. CF038]